MNADQEGVPAQRPAEAESPPPKSPRGAKVVAGLIVAELAVLIWGYWVFSHADYRQCSGAPEVDLHEAGDMPWVPWLVLAPLVGITLTLRKGRLTTAVSGASLLILVVTFPGTIIAIESMSCSL